MKMLVLKAKRNFPCSILFVWHAHSLSSRMNGGTEERVVLALTNCLSWLRHYVTCFDNVNSSTIIKIVKTRYYYTYFTSEKMEGQRD